MYKKIFFILITAVCFCNAKADTPGKAKMHESKVTFQGVKKIAGYSFYWKMEHADKGDVFTTDSSFILLSSGGAPYRYSFWAINNATQKSTDTIPFDNYYAPDYVVIINAIKNDSIYFTKQELSNANKIVHEGNTDSIENKQLVADAKAAKNKHYLNTTLYCLAGAAGIGGLIWFFARRRKKKLEA